MTITPDFKELPALLQANGMQRLEFIYDTLGETLQVTAAIAAGTTTLSQQELQTRARGAIAAVKVALKGMDLKKPDLLHMTIVNDPDSQGVLFVTADSALDEE